jgi:hypothetical protein
MKCFTSAGLEIGFHPHAGGNTGFYHLKYTEFPFSLDVLPLDPLGPLGPLDFVELLRGSQPGADLSSL